MTWDDLDRLERLTYAARKGRLYGYCAADEARDYENRTNRAEMGDDLDDW